MIDGGHNWYSLSPSLFHQFDEKERQKEAGKNIKPVDFSALQFCFRKRPELAE
jgi:hypothetical protein